MEDAMLAGLEASVRHAVQDDVGAIRGFGETHIPAHYTPLIGIAAANDQVRIWWDRTRLSAAVADGLIVVAEVDGQLVGVGQRGRDGADQVIYKLYVHPQYRGHGLGPRLIEVLVRDLPDGTTRLYIEHFAGNQRAGAFYEREGFTIERTEPSPSDDPALAVVWRVRDLTSAGETPSRSVSRAGRP